MYQFGWNWLELISTLMEETNEHNVSMLHILFTRCCVFTLQTVEVYDTNYNTWQPCILYFSEEWQSKIFLCPD